MVTVTVETKLLCICPQLFQSVLCKATKTPTYILILNAVLIRAGIKINPTVAKK